MKKILVGVFSIMVLISCESETQKGIQLADDNNGIIDFQQIDNDQREADSINLEQERIEKELYDKYISNSLQTGSTPYSEYYGGNSSCDDYGCSQIKVQTSDSDVLVTIKKNDKVVRHAYIKAGDNYTFSFPNGTYQAFFYYGKGWNPEKEMKGGEIKGGFISEENFGKDDPQSLSNSILEYKLILQQNGNFSTRPSNPDEAL